MLELNDKQLTMRIESFIARKHQQFPELALRGDKRKTESVAYFTKSKNLGLIKTTTFARLAH